MRNRTARGTRHKLKERASVTARVLRRTKKYRRRKDVIAMASERHPALFANFALLRNDVSAWSLDHRAITSAIREIDAGVVRKFRAMHSIATRRFPFVEEGTPAFVTRIPNRLDVDDSPFLAWRAQRGRLIRPIPFMVP